jgi:hypothetical protein
MSSKRPNNLCQDVVKVTNKYFGPAADRFVTRQIDNHLNKKPEELAIEDLESLIDWIKLAMALLTEDTYMLNQYINELTELTLSSHYNNKSKVLVKAKHI